MHRRLREYHFLFVMIALVGAGVCYAAGFGLGIIPFLIAGALFELAFWILALTSTADSGALKPAALSSKGRHFFLDKILRPLSQHLRISHQSPS